MKKRLIYSISLLLVIISISCYKIPNEGTISNNFVFASQNVTVRLGSQQISKLDIKIFETTIPFKVSVNKVFAVDQQGNKTQDVTHLFLANVEFDQWKSEFTGEEKNADEFYAKREKTQMPILAFNNANQLVFNYGNDKIEPGNYIIDVSVANSSGNKVFSDMLNLTVQEKESYLFYTVNSYTKGYKDAVNEFDFQLIKKSDSKNSLTISIKEVNGTTVPLDSLRPKYQTTSMDGVFHFNKTVTSEKSEYTLPYPFPYKPDNVYKYISKYSGQRLWYQRYGMFEEEVDKLDENGDPVLDENGDPVKVMEMVESLRYSFYIMLYIFEPGEWELTINLK